MRCRATTSPRAVRDDYCVHLARDADEAMAPLHDLGPEIAVLVTDFRMPGRDGGHLLREVGETYPQIVRILVTAYADKDMLLQTFNTGDLFRILEVAFRVESVREVLRQAVTRYAERETRQQRLLAMEETLAFLAHELNTPPAANLGSRQARWRTTSRRTTIPSVSARSVSRPRPCSTTRSIADADLVVLGDGAQERRPAAGGRGSAARGEGRRAHRHLAGLVSV